MTRRDAWLSIGAGLLLLLSVAFILPTFGVLAGLFWFDFVLQVWYVGVALVVAAFLLQRRQLWPVVARVLGCLGVAWVAFVAGYVVLVVGLFFVFGGFTG